jgi:mono/diheme cytochrome c family protein
MVPSSAYLSKDARTVFLGLPDMKPVMQMRVGWTLLTQSGLPSEHNAYFTVHALSRFDPEQEGFAPLTVDLTPKQGQLAVDTPRTIEEGQRLATLMACLSCHSTDGTVLGKVGPSWKGLFGSEVPLINGRRAVANEAYLRESILDPTAAIVRGFDKSDAGMPSYQGVLTEAQIDALILYIQSLR